MPVEISLDQIRLLAPSARSSYRNAFANGQSVLETYEISASPLRIAHFMAQVLHECGGLTIQFENMNYTAERLPVVWPKRFKPKGPLDPQEYAHNPQKLANAVYGGRLGNDGPDDGWIYRGRGLLQLTGKESYRNSTTNLRKVFSQVPDLVAQPDQVISQEWCLHVAAEKWKSSHCDVHADNDDINGVTRCINGALTNKNDRRQWLVKTKFVWK
jgi:putative chitinase